MKLTRKIINRFIFYCSLLVILLIARCKDEKEVARVYPRLSGTSITNITDSGATFKADLYSFGTESPVEYGFVWGIGEKVHYNTFDKIILGKPEGTGIFSADIRSALIKDRKYGVVPFVKTEERIVYGPVATFNSLGSKAPVIYGFYPDSAAWGDTVEISGKHFSYITKTIITSLNSVECESVKSTDTTIFFVVNPLIKFIKNVISVELAGNIYKFTKDTFNLIPPRIIDFQPRQGLWGDTITISGKSLSFLKYLPSNYIKLGTFSCFGVPVPSDTLIRIFVPHEITANTCNLSLNINGFALTGPGPFTILTPYMSFSPVAGTWGNTVTLNGRFNTLTTRNKVYFNSIQSTITSVSATKMTVTVPSTLSDIKSVIKYNVTPFNVVSADSFTLLPPIIKTFAPAVGPWSTIVIVKGKNFGTSSAILKFGTITAQITGINDSIIITKVPVGVNGSVKISVTAYNQSITSTDDFLVTNPRITGIYPLSGTFNDEITITGENFIPPSGNTTVTFESIPSIIKSITADAIVVQVPLAIDSIPSSIKVTAGPNSIISADKFILSPPQITSIVPSVTILGQDIKISGNNFNPVATSNQAWWGPYSLKVKSSSASEIIATPLKLFRGTNKISVTTGGYKRDFPSLIEIKSCWSNISPSTSLNWNSAASLYGNGVSFSILGKGYMMDLYNARMTSFNPVTNEFLDLGIKEVFKGVTGLTCVVNEDTAYLISGNLGIFRFDISTNNWVSIGASPTNSKYGVAFSCNGKIYYGLTYNPNSYTLDNSLWVYDLNSKNWTALGKFPGLSMTYSYHSIAFCTIDNKGYVLLANKQFWKYDPVTDTWFQLSSLPLSDYTRINCVSFVIDGKIIVGTGFYDGEYLDDFWIYDKETNVWTKTSYSMPLGGRRNSISFTINNKAYIGFGYKYDRIQVKDFYEFDPNYPLK